MQSKIDPGSRSTSSKNRKRLRLEIIVALVPPQEGGTPTSALRYQIIGLSYNFEIPAGDRYSYAYSRIRS